MGEYQNKIQRTAKPCHSPQEEIRSEAVSVSTCTFSFVENEVFLNFLEHFSFFRSRLHRQAFASLARAMILAKEAGDGGMPMARTARAAFTKSSPVPVWL